MKLPLLAIVLLVATLLFSACSLDDPFGATTRAQIRSNAQVRIAEADAQAQIVVAQETSEAKVQTAQTWAATLPIALLIVVVGIIGAIIVTYQGKIYLARATNDDIGPALPAPMPLDKLQDHANRTGQGLYIEDGVYYLVDNTGKMARALPRRQQQ